MNQTKKPRQPRLRWEEWWAFAKAYREEFGDLRVPRNYTTPSGRRLGEWIEGHRVAYEGKGTRLLTADRIAALESIGMEWELKKQTPWSCYYLSAERYFAANGNLMVPVGYKEKDGLWLGEWVRQQRKKYKKGRLTPEQVQKLENIGIQWVIYQRPSWNHWYQMLQNYFYTYGNIEISSSYRTPDGYALGMWLCCQRRRYKKQPSPLTFEQIAALERLGMVWNYSKPSDKKRILWQTNTIRQTAI